MESSISQLVETFRHIARDIFVYLLGGAVVVLNLVFIDFDCNGGKLSIWASNLPYLPLLLTLLTYLFGQIIMAVMFMVFDSFIEPALLQRKIVKDISSEDTQKEVEIFMRNRSAYDYFIERQNQLYYMRWGLAGSGIVCALLYSIFALLYKHLYLFYGTGFSALFCFIFAILHYRTAKDYISRIQFIHEELSKNQSK